MEFKMRVSNFLLTLKGEPHTSRIFVFFFLIKRWVEGGGILVPLTNIYEL